MEVKVREWLRKGNEAGHFVQRLSDIVPKPKIDFKVGDKVVFTNDYGGIIYRLNDNRHW